MQKFVETITAMSNGVLVPLDSATVAVYAAGTQTLATLYSTNSTSTPRANPLTSSATGLVSFYAADGRYDIRVEKAGFGTVTISDVLLEDPADGIIKVISDATITASTVDSTPIGATAASTGRFTSVRVVSGATGTITLGEMRLNATDNTVDVGLGNGVTGQMFKELFIDVKNNSAGTYTNGQVVAFTGVNGSNPIVELAVADEAFQPLYTVGVLTNDILPGATGQATTFGKVRDVNTTGSSVGETWAGGDILYIHPSIPGAMTNVEPTAPNVAIPVAAVITANAITGLMLVRAYPGNRTHYGVFSSTVDQTAAAINTAYAVQFDTTDVSSGVSVDETDASLVVCSRAGLYNFQFSAQLVKSSSSVGYVWIWPRLNGVDVPNSASKVSIAGSGSETIPAWNFVLSMAAADEFQLMYAVSSTAVSFDAAAATAFCPATPSVILTVTQINK
jgi:hypothetical protein